MNKELDKQKALSVEQETRESELDYAGELFNDGKIDLLEISQLILEERHKQKMTLATRIALDCIVTSGQIDWEDSESVSEVDDSILDFALQRMASAFINKRMRMTDMEYKLRLLTIVNEKLRRETQEISNQLKAMQ